MTKCHVSLIACGETISRHRLKHVYILIWILVCTILVTALYCCAERLLSDTEKEGAIYRALTRELLMTGSLVFLGGQLQIRENSSSSEEEAINQKNLFNSSTISISLLSLRDKRQSETVGRFQQSLILTKRLRFGITFHRTTLGQVLRHAQFAESQVIRSKKQVTVEEVLISVQSFNRRSCRARNKGRTRQLEWMKPRYSVV